MTPASVVLVSMPWAALGEPSLGLSVLRSVLDQAQVTCRVRHLNLFMLRYLKATTYLALANTFALNDFVFSGIFEREVTGRQLRHLRARVEEMLTIGLVKENEYGGPDGVVNRIIELRRNVVPGFLRREAESIVRSGATLVGLTCMFDQTVASLALAKCVKEIAPDVVVALGGYAVRDPAGRAIMHSFPWIDAVCLGEGENVIVSLARASRGDLQYVPGILYRDADGAVQATGPAAQVAMDSSPIPNFDDYFSDLKELAAEDKVHIDVDTLPYETARGCWWGERKHCTFCGIHDDDMAYRSRSSATVISALAELKQRYGIGTFRLSDYILPNIYFKTLLPDLAAMDAPFRLACEMKANSSVSRFALLAAAGFTEVQPGIESFSTDVLRKMDKGVTAVMNVLTLILGRRFNIHIHYNILYGFPDDDPDAYEQMIAQLPRLFHLDPPITRTSVQITRYAPLQADPQRFGLRVAHYEPAYELIFSKDFTVRHAFDLDAYCYYFERPFEPGTRLSSLYSKLIRLLDEWKLLQAEREVELSFTRYDDAIVFTDTRSGMKSSPRLTGIPAQVYACCIDQPRTCRSTAEMLGVPEAQVATCVAELDKLGLIFRDRACHIGLAVPSAAPEKCSAIGRLWAIG